MARRKLFASLSRLMLMFGFWGSFGWGSATFAADRNEVRMPVVALDAATTITPERVVATIYTLGGMPRELAPGEPYDPRAHYPKIILMLTDRGELVWSADRIKGGPPYFQTRIDSKRVTRLIDALHAGNLLTSPTMQGANYGPDAAFTAIFLRRGSEYLETASWHELYEHNSSLVATATGLQSLNGRDRAAVLAAQPPNYRAYRAGWDAIKTKLFDLVPKDGASARPDARIQVTGVAWIELPKPVRK